MDFLHTFSFFKEIDFWIVKILVVTFLAVIVNYVLYFINRKIKKSLSNKGYYFFKTALDSVYQPLIIYIWFTHVLYMFRQLPFQGNDLFTSLSVYSRKVDLGKNIFLFWWAWFKFTGGIEKFFLGAKMKAHVQDKTQVQIISKLVRIVSIIFLTISIFPVFAIPVSGIVAFAGSSAFVISFASKDLFSNYLGGLMVHLDGYFRVGDWIITSVSGKEIEGIIEFIGWRHTLIRTPERRALYLPNYYFLSSVIENFTKSNNIRIYENIEIQIENIDKITSITEEIRKYLNSHPDIDLNQRNICFLEKVINNVASIRILAFTKTIDRFEYKEVIHKILQGACEIVLKEGASMVVPVRFLKN